MGTEFESFHLQKPKVLKSAIVNWYIEILKPMLIDNKYCVDLGHVYIVFNINIYSKLRYHNFIICSFGDPWFWDIDDIKPLYLAANVL